MMADAVCSAFSASCTAFRAASAARSFLDAAAERSAATARAA